MSRFPNALYLLLGLAVLNGLMGVYFLSVGATGGAWLYLGFAALWAVLAWVVSRRSGR